MSTEARSRLTSESSWEPTESAIVTIHTSGGVQWPCNTLALHYTSYIFCAACEREREREFSMESSLYTNAS